MVRLGQHPRRAHLVLKGRDLAQGKIAALIAAILGERDFLRERDVDLCHRIDRALSGHAPRLITETARRLTLRPARDEPPDPSMTGTLLALAYPDRIGRRRSGTANRYLLSGGRGAALPEGDPMSNEEFLVVADLDGTAQDARIFLAAPITLGAIEELYGEQITDEEIVDWRDGTVVARRRRRLGALVLEDKPINKPDPKKVKAAMLAGLSQRGLPWTDALQAWRQRIAFLRHGDKSWPDLSDDALLRSLDWLDPFVDGAARRIDLAAAVQTLLPWDRQREMDRLAPTHLVVPSGSRVPIDYTNPAEPTLSVRLQEMFGLTATPALANQIPVTIHLLSPARRPVQVTRDLASFWKTTYRDVKAELKGRYPKHYWPDDPLVAPPMARPKPRR
jgi:ATP-dependent helicase HrpB